MQLRSLSYVYDIRFQFIRNFLSFVMLGIRKWIQKRNSINMAFEPSPSTFAVVTAVEKPIPSFTHRRLPGNYGSDYAIARSSCVKCEGEGSLV